MRSNDTIRGEGKYITEMSKQAKVMVLASRFNMKMEVHPSTMKLNRGPDINPLSSITSMEMCKRSVQHKYEGILD